MARFLFLPLLLSCLGTAAAVESPLELTLPQAVSFALQHHPSLRTRAAALLPANEAAP